MPSNTEQNKLGQLGMQAAGGAVGGILGQIFSGWNTDKQVNANQDMINQQVAASKEMSNYSQGLQKEMWDYTNYENQKKHLENAGLNAALLYGKGGGGGATVGGGGMQGGSGGASRGGENIQGAIMGMQMQTQAAQIEMMKAQANKANADADKTRGVDTENTGANTEYTKTLTGNAQIDGQIKQIAANVANATEMAQIDRYKTEWAQEINKLEILESQNKIAKGTVETQIKQAKQSLINSVTQNTLMKSNIKLNNEKIREITETLLQNWGKLDLMQNAQEYAQKWGMGISPVGSILKNVDDILKGLIK